MGRPVLLPHDRAMSHPSSPNPPTSPPRRRSTIELKPLLAGLIFGAALVVLDLRNTIRYRPRLRRFERLHPTLSRIDRRAVPSADVIRRHRSDGRPVLGKPGQRHVTHRLTARVDASIDDLYEEVAAVARRAGWRRTVGPDSRREWHPPADGHRHALSITVSGERPATGGEVAPSPAAVVVRLDDRS